MNLIRFLILMLFSMNLSYGFSIIFPLHLSAEYGQVYNSNIFRLSEYDRNRFDLFDYREMKSIDDLISIGNVQMQYNFRFLKKKNMLWLDISMKKYIKNPAHDFLIFKTYFRRYLNRRDYFEFQYFFLPNYFVRYYKDRESVWTKSFLCRYSDQRFKLKLSLHPGRLNTLQLYLQSEQLYFNSRFTEYDQTLYIGGINLYRSFSGLQRIGILTSFRYSDNVNRSETSDLSYFEERLGLLYRKRSIEIFRKEAEASISITGRYRTYLSENLPSEDEFHVGRVSYRQLYSCDILYPFRNNLFLNLYVSYEFRKILKGYESVKRIKEFSSFEGGMRIRIRIN